ncbi:fimbrial protein [Enterobacter roggenkampii]|uniref:fimbrial protein n=1 Tax=Enterobacter roggenkampii TaxID=1812935 RepID=UPI000B1D62FB|nr:fimbrial protein [Enterobacter roggenkampii]
MKRNPARQWVLRCCLVALFTSTAGAPMAVLAGRTATVTVKVTVVEVPPCIINGNRVIEVDFGDVIVPQIDGHRYMKSINYSLECTGQLRNAMKLAIQGNTTTFDHSALKTNVEDFGIAMRMNGQPLGINSWVNFVYPNKPLLQAVPVKRAGVDLPGGEFSAGATLMVHYQ